MKVAVLAGGFGTRLAEETEIRPKPMVEIGGKPILWHIMKIYAHYGFKDFVIALGYKGEYIKKYMVDYCSLTSNLTVNLKNGEIVTHEGDNLDWTVQLIDTGLKTQTGGRIKRLAPYIDNQTFMLTWGDGVADIDLNKLLAFHRSHGKLATVTAVRPTARFGGMALQQNQVTNFKEKPQGGEGWINGGFFVMEQDVFKYLDDDQTVLEASPLERLSKEGQLMAYQHDGFWQCMDTVRDRQHLEEAWKTGDAPWKVWND